MSTAESGVGTSALGWLPEAGNLHLLAVLNRYSSNYPGALKRFDQLVELKYLGTDDYIETKPTRTDTGLLLCDTLAAGRQIFNGVIALTGDGGANTIGHGLHDSGDENICKVPLILGKGGGACDGHHNTQGNNPEYLQTLPGQPLLPLYPLDIKVTFSDGREDRTEKALSHTSVGLSGEIADDVNNILHRESWMLQYPRLHRLQQYLTALGSVANMRSFYLREPGEPWRKTYEHALVKGRNFGGYDKFPGDLTSREYQEIEANHFGEVMHYGARLLQQQEVAFVPRTSSEFMVAPAKQGQALYLQFDGEVIRLTSGEEKAAGQPQPIAHIKASGSDRPLRIAAPALIR